MVKELLPKEWQDQIATELIGLSKSWLLDKKTQDPIAEVITKRIHAIYNYSKLAEEEKDIVLAEVTYSLALAQTKPSDLVTHELNALRLQRCLAQIRPETIKELSLDQEALYNQMLRVASEGIIEVADQIAGFIQALGGALLRGQRDLDNKPSKYCIGKKN